MAAQLHQPYFLEFGGEGLKPGDSYGVFIPVAGLHQLTATITAIPYPVAGSRVCSLSVGDVAVTREPVSISPYQVLYAGTYVKNIGNAAIGSATVWLSTVGL